MTIYLVIIVLERSILSATAGFLKIFFCSTTKLQEKIFKMTREGGVSGINPTVITWHIMADAF